jgi:hypothetical protein
MGSPAGGTQRCASRPLKLLGSSYAPGAISPRAAGSTRRARERVSGLGWSPRRGRRGDPRSSVPPDSWLTSDADRAGVAFELAGAADVDGLDLDAQPPAGQRAVEPQA